jgi:uncharacterized protein YggE
VTLGDLTEAGKLIDLATQGGANQIQRLQFSLKDEKPARAQALRQASLEARANADAMAAALGLKLGPVLLIEQVGSEPIRPRMAAMAELAGARTPVEPGAVEVHASITLTVLIQ